MVISIMKKKPFANRALQYTQKRKKRKHGDYILD